MPATIPTAGSRQESTEATRAKVVRAARTAFATQGYSGASMRKIAAEAGLTAMALYTYAPAKQALFQLVYADGIALIYAEYAEVVVGRATLLDEVLAVIDRGGELLASDPDLLHFTIRVAADRDHEDLRGLDLLTGPEIRFYEGMAARAIGRGELDPAESTRLVSFVIMLLWGLSSMAALGPGHLENAVRTARWTAEGCLRRPVAVPPPT